MPQFSRTIRSYRITVRVLIVMVAGFLLASLTSATRAADWPQILGPKRTGISTESIPHVLGKSGPPTVWKKSVGSGFAGVAVVGKRAVYFHRQQDKEIAVAVSTDDGSEIWTRSFPTNFAPGFTPDGGPRCVPLISSDRVFLFGASGGLRCISLKDGSIIWQVETQRKFKSPDGFFGAGSTPVLDGDRLIVNVGSRNGAGVVAFHANDGKVLWKSTNEYASYSSPLVADIDGTRHALVISRMKMLSLDPTNGKVRFQFPFGKRGPTVNGASPVVFGNNLLLTASYGIGAELHSLKDTGSKRVWQDGFLSSQYATPIRVGDAIFAVNGRQDSGPKSASLMCFDPRTKTVHWQKDNFDYGTLICAGDTLLFLTCGGELILVEANPKAYNEFARAKVLQPSPSGYRLPALSNGKLYVRDDRTLKCLDLSGN